MATDDLNAVVLKAIADAYARGYEAGKDAARKTLMSAVEVAFASTPIAVSESSGSDVEASAGLDADDEAATRAPRGLTERIVQHIVANNLPITTEEIQRQAVEMDERVNPKTVYNVLYRSSHRYFRDERSRWRMKSAPQQTQIFDTAEDRATEEPPNAAL